MSFFRTVVTTFAALVIASPVLADDSMGTQNTSSTTEQTTTTTQVTSEQTKLDLNKATTKDLMKIKGINAARARAIVAYRKKHGNFKSVDNLSKIKGFKKLKADKMDTIKAQLIVD